MATCPICLGKGDTAILQSSYVSGTKIQSTSKIPCFMCNGLGEIFETETIKPRTGGKKTTGRKNNKKRRKHEMRKDYE